MTTRKWGSIIRIPVGGILPEVHSAHAFYTDSQSTDDEKAFSTYPRNTKKERHRKKEEHRGRDQLKLIL